MSLNENATSQPLSDEVLDLRQSIDESAAEIRAQSVQFEKPRKKGGRPPGSRDKAPRKRPAHLSMAPSIESTISEHPGGPSVSPAPPPVELQPSPAVPMIAIGFKVPFQIAAAKTQCDEVKLTDEEATAIAIEADKCLQMYLPQLEMDPRRAALISLIVALGGVSVAKYMALAKFEEERKTASKKAREEGTPNRPFPVNEDPVPSKTEAVEPRENSTRSVDDLFAQNPFAAKQF